MSDFAAFMLLCIVIVLCVSTCMIVRPPSDPKETCIKERGAWSEWQSTCNFGGGK